MWYFEGKLLPKKARRILFWPYLNSCSPVSARDLFLGLANMPAAWHRPQNRDLPSRGVSQARGAQGSYDIKTVAEPSHDDIDFTNYTTSVQSWN